MEIDSLINPKKKNRLSNPIRVRSSIGQEGNSYSYANYGSEEGEAEKDPKREGERNRRYMKQYLR